MNAYFLRLAQVFDNASRALNKSPVTPLTDGCAHQQLRSSHYSQAFHQSHVTMWPPGARAECADCGQKLCLRWVPE